MLISSGWISTPDFRQMEGPQGSTCSSSPSPGLSHATCQRVGQIACLLLCVFLVATADLRAQEGSGRMDSFAFADCLDISKGVPRMSFGCLWLAVQKKVKMLDSQASRLLEGTFC